MSYLDESNVQDLVDQVTQFQDDLEEKQTLLDTALAGIQGFLLQETTPEDYKKSRRLYQYELKNQMEWFRHKSIVDSHLMHIYPVIESLIDKLFIHTRESAGGRGRTSNMETPKPTDAPNQPITPPQTSQGILEKLRGALGGKQTIEEELDPWKGNYDLLQEAKAYPKTWKTLNRLHATNVIRAKKFPGITSQQNTIEIEWYYLSSRVEPSISTMIERSRQILRDSDTERVGRILSQFYQSKEKHRLDFTAPPS